MSRILVTGGAGFIGSHLVDELVRRGHRVSVIDDLSSGERGNVNAKARFYRNDIRSRRLDGIFQREKPHLVFHLAAQKSVRKSVTDPASDADINILGSLNVFEQCRRHRVKKVIFSSTGGALYGDTKNIPTPESQIEKPISPYGVAKLAIEKYLYYYHQIFSLKYVSLRYANVYGPRQDPEGEAGVVAIFLERILLNEQPYINGHGRQTRDYIYIDDVVKANILAMQNKVQGIYNIGTAKKTSVNDLYDQLRQISHTRLQGKHRSALAGEQQHSCLSYAKFKRVAHWRPKVDLNKGLRLTYHWFKSRYE